MTTKLVDNIYYIFIRWVKVYMLI